jgi:hypothetical protein
LTAVSQFTGDDLRPTAGVDGLGELALAGQGGPQSGQTDRFTLPVARSDDQGKGDGGGRDPVFVVVLLGEEVVEGVCQE